MNRSERDKAPIGEGIYFHTTPGYSDFWRRDTSCSETMELAKLLRSIRAVAAYVGCNTGEIVWEGMSSDSGSITLDPAPIMGVYPVPGARADIIIGLAIQKCFYRTEFSGQLVRLAMEGTSLPGLYRDKFCHFINMAELIHGDCLANRSALGYYAQAARRWQIAGKRPGFITPPTLDELLHIWWRMAAHRSGKQYREPFRDRSAGGMTERTSLEKFYSAPLKLLNGMVEPLIHDCQRLRGKKERVEARLALYLSVWPRLLASIRFWPGGRGDRYLLGDRYEEEMAAEALAQTALWVTVRSSVKRVEDHMQGPNVDFTQNVRSVVDNDEDVVAVESDDIVTPAKDRVDLNLLWRFKRVLHSVSPRKTTKIRGLRSGKIDGRRLFRAATTGAVFHLRKNEFVLDHDVVLLIDCSGSMDSPRKLAHCETLYQTLFTAIETVNLNVRIYGYNELRNTCRITRLHTGGRFHTILPHGKTASGEAIIATAVGMVSRHARSPLLFHITDGAANWGCGVDGAIRFCQRNHIHLLTLGLECHPADRCDLKKEYGDRVQFVDQLEKVPSLLEGLLRCLQRHWPVR